LDNRLPLIDCLLDYLALSLSHSVVEGCVDGKRASLNDDRCSRLINADRFRFAIAQIWLIQGLPGGRGIQSGLLTLSDWREKKHNGDQ